MKEVQNKLYEGFKSVELEERLEMVHLTALTESADMSLLSDIERSTESAPPAVE